MVFVSLLALGVILVAVGVGGLVWLALGMWALRHLERVEHTPFDPGATAPPALQRRATEFQAIGFRLDGTYANDTLTSLALRSADGLVVAEAYQHRRRARRTSDDGAVIELNTVLADGEGLLVTSTRPRDGLRRQWKRELLQILPDGSASALLQRHMEALAWLEATGLGAVDCSSVPYDLLLREWHDRFRADLRDTDAFLGSGGHPRALPEVEILAIDPGNAEKIRFVRAQARANR